MRLSEIKQEQLKKYIEDNELGQSYIDTKVLWQCRPLLPETKIVGKDEKGNIILFEETSGSLQRRHYGRSTKATSFNLIYCNGVNGEKVTKKYLKENKIEFKGGYDLEILLNFIKNNNNRFNALNHDKKRQYSFTLSEVEKEYVKEFIKKMRRYKDENSQG